MIPAHEHELIAQFYHAAAHPTAWTSTLERLCDLAQAREAVVIAWNRGAPDCRQNESSGRVFDEAAHASYESHYIEVDPGRELSLRGTDSWRVGAPCFSHELFSQEFIARNEFYQDFLVKRGIHFSFSMTLRDTTDSITSVVLHRSYADGPFERAACDRMMSSFAHLRRALQLQRQVSELDRRSDDAERALNALPQGVMLLDHHGQVIFTNEASRKLLLSVQSLRVWRGRLQAPEVSLDDRLQALIRRALATARECADAAAASSSLSARAEALGADVATLPVRLDAHRTAILEAYPLAPGTLAGIGQGAAMMLTLRLNAPATPGSSQVAAELFGFSRAEARLCDALLEGKTPEEAATDFGISIHTTRTQIRALLLKSGARRTTDLLRLLDQLRPVRTGT